MTQGRFKLLLPVSTARHSEELGRYKQNKFQQRKMYSSVFGWVQKYRMGYIWLDSSMHEKDLAVI